MDHSGRAAANVGLPDCPRRHDLAVPELVELRQGRADTVRRHFTVVVLFLVRFWLRR
jgi:hypothetical protein